MGVINTITLFFVNIFWMLSLNYFLSICLSCLPEHLSLCSQTKDFRLKVTSIGLQHASLLWGTILYYHVLHIFLKCLYISVLMRFSMDEVFTISIFFNKILLNLNHPLSVWLFVCLSVDNTYPNVARQKIWGSQLLLSLCHTKLFFLQNQPNMKNLSCMLGCFIGDCKTFKSKSNIWKCSLTMGYYATLTNYRFFRY
jgi:hypothetical protein